MPGDQLLGPAQLPGRQALAGADRDLGRSEAILNVGQQRQHDLLDEQFVALARPGEAGQQRQRQVIDHRIVDTDDPLRLGGRALPFFVEKLLYRSARQHEADIVVSCPAMEILFRGCPPSKTSLFPFQRRWELKSRNCTMTENESAQGIWITLSGSGVASLLRIKAYPSPLMMFPGVDWSPFVLSMATVMTPPDSMRPMIS